MTALLAGALAVAFSISGAPAGAASNAPLATARIPVIIDTDNFSNTDDAGALASAFALDLQGVVNVVAIGVDTRISRPAVATNSWKCAAAIAQFYGFSNVPIGSDMPDNGTSVNSPDIVGPCASFASPTTPAPQSAVSVYRRALASQPNGSVVMVGIGYEENLVALLDSPPDSISPLDGHDLIAEKVKTLTITGGGYPSKSSPGENNFAGNPAAAAVVASSWPTKVVYSGFEVGNGVFTGHTLTSVHPADSPVRADYEALVGPNKNNRSYDLTTLYHAIYPNDPLLTEVGPGTNAIDSVGGNVFTAGAGDEYYLSLSSATALAAVLEALLDVLPGTSPQKITFTSTPPASPKVGDTYSASATGGGSSNPVTFSIDAASTSGCAVNATTGLVTFSGPAGTCVIDANQAGDTTYAAAPQVQQPITVAKAPQTVTFTSTPPASPKVGDTYTAAATGGASSNPVTFSIDAASTSGCTVNATTGLVTFSGPAGTCVIDANQAGNASYTAAPQVQQTITVAKDPQKITFTSTAPKSPIIGGTYVVTASSTSHLVVAVTIDKSTTSICSISSGKVLFLKAGTCIIDANQAGNASYTAAPQVQQILKVTTNNVARIRALRGWSTA